MHAVCFVHFCTASLFSTVGKRACRAVVLDFVGPLPTLLYYSKDEERIIKNGWKR